MSHQKEDLFNGFTNGEIRLIKILVNKHLGLGYELSTGQFDPGDEEFERAHGEIFAQSLKRKYTAWLEEQEAKNPTVELIERLAQDFSGN